jgi:Uma2 family endonuclease
MDELGFFEGQRVMLIDGEVIAMSPMNEAHARGIVFSLQALEAAFGPSVTYRSQMPMDLGQRTDPEPDIAVIDGPPRSQPAAPPSTALLVVEVANHSLGYDLGDKSSLYAAAGIADYWGLDVANARLHIHRDPHPDSSQRFGCRYSVQRVLRPTDRVSPLAALSSSILVADMLP